MKRLFLTILLAACSTSSPSQPPPSTTPSAVEPAPTPTEQAPMEQAPAASMDAGAAEIDTANPADAGAAPTPQQTGGTGSASGSAAAGAIGDKCGPNDACVAGATCVKYYGIAGPRGPQFTSCEIKCSPSGKPGCPTGKKCVTIADGPGSVCR